MNFGFHPFPIGQVASQWSLFDYARGLTPTSNVGYTNIGNITDGIDTTVGAATSVAVPQWVMVDLGVARFIRRSRILFVTTNRSANGILQCSPDNSTWTDVISWTGDTSLDRLLTVNAVGRYWRIYTTATGTPGSSGVNIYTWNLWG